MPNCFKVLANRFQVPPYKSVDVTKLSPAWHKFITANVLAAWPDEVARAATPPSSAARRCSSTSWVGFIRRV